jgi:glucokinase
MSEMDHDFIGIEIGGTKLQIVAGDAMGRIRRRWRARVDREAGGPGICRQIVTGIGEIRRSLQSRAIGIGFGGPVDWKTGRICRSHQVAGWENFEISRWLTQESGLPVVVDNDSNAAALAEATRGAGAGDDPVFYFNLGSGVGGGLAVNGRIYHGAPPGEMEFGHLRLDPGGATVESRCSGWAVDQRIRTLATSRPDSYLARVIGAMPGGEAAHLPSALQKGDVQAREILGELSNDVAFALSHVIHLLHPAVIVLGGGLSLIGEPLRAAVADAIPQYLMAAFAPGPPVRLSLLGEDAVPFGALLLAASAALQ